MLNTLRMNNSFPETPPNAPNIFFYSCQPTLSFSLITGKSRARSLGKFVDQQTQTYRIKAHLVFDRLFEGQNPLMTRAEAYQYLQNLMNLDEKDAHIGKFSIPQCKEIIDLLDFKE